MIRLALIGAAGRTGRLVVQSLPAFPEFELVAAVVASHSPLVGSKVADHESDLRYTSDLRAAIGLADVVVDFSRPEISVDVARACAELLRPCLIGTTGQSADQLAAIMRYAQATPILIAPNTSLGLQVAAQMAALGARDFGPEIEVEIAELHHHAKRDSPSGTAKFLASIVAPNSPIVIARTGQRQCPEIGIASMRGGDVGGEHTVYFFLDGERVEVTHRVTDRAIFARGALRLARRLMGRKPGLHGIHDLES